MAETPTIKSYTFRVALGDMDNPTIHTARTIGRDVQRAEQEFARRGWGKTESRPMTSAAMVAWSALQRVGVFPGSFEDFEAQYLEVSAEDPVTIRPTEAAPAPA